MSEFAEGMLEVLPASHKRDEIFSDEDLATLNETRSLRKALVKLLAPENKVPEDKADKTMLLNLLNGLDSEVIARARIKVAAKTEENNANLAALVGQAMKNFKVSSAHPTQKMLEMPSHIKTMAPVPGQMDVGTILVSIEELTDD